MKTTHILLSLAVLLLLWSSCKPSCPDPGNQVNYVDKTYLPDIIPYSDTSTALFLKNGKDTLLFKSQGLKETYVGSSTLDSDCPKNYSNQQYILTMKASDTDYFEIDYNISYVQFKLVKRYISKNLHYRDFLKYYPPVLTQTVLNTKYDTLSLLRNDLGLVVYAKPKLGVVKIVNANTTYELIK
jgi:hypothetical protein